MPDVEPAGEVLALAEELRAAARRTPRRPRRRRRRWRAWSGRPGACGPGAPGASTGRRAARRAVNTAAMMTVAERVSTKVAPATTSQAMPHPRRTTPSASCDAEHDEREQRDHRQEVAVALDALDLAAVEEESRGSSRTPAGPSRCRSRSRTAARDAGRTRPRRTRRAARGRGSSGRRATARAATAGHSRHSARKRAAIVVHHCRATPRALAPG